MLLKIARSRLGGCLIGWTMEHWSRLLPVERLYETPLLVAFKHPKPVYSTHFLIVPKKAIPNLAGLSREGEAFLIQFMKDLLGCVSQLVAVYDLEKPGYRLIVNGGNYQEIPQIHFHLVSGPTV